jgi:putative redox protein
MVEIEIVRTQGDFGFEARDAAGHVVLMDNSVESGGENFGASPMQLLLMGLGGCSGIDVVMILKKQRQRIDDFRMKITGEREPGMVPALWKSATIVFELTGDIDPVKARRACELSMEKYCSVAETLRRAGCRVAWDLELHSVATAGADA